MDEMVGNNNVLKITSTEINKKNHKHNECKTILSNIHHSKKLCKVNDMVLFHLGNDVETDTSFI